MTQKTKQKTLYMMPVGGNNSNQNGALGGNANLIGIGHVGLEKFPPNMIQIDFGNIHFKDVKKNGKKIDYLMSDLDDIYPSVSSSKKPKTKAILLTHLHDDHITGLAHTILRGRKVPKIIAPQMTLDVLRAYLDQHGYDPKKQCDYETETAHPKQPIKIDKDWTVTPFSVSHSTPDCLGFLVEGAGQRVVHTGDLKLDQTVLLGPKTDLEFLKNLAKTGGVDGFLIDSTKGDKGHDFIYDDVDMRQDIKEIFNKHVDQRIIAAFYAGYLELISSMIVEAANQNRKVIIASELLKVKMNNFERDGLSFEDLLRTKTDKPIHIFYHDDDRVKQLPENETFIMTDGVVNNQTSLLGQIIYQSHPWFKFNKNDALYMAKNVMLVRPKFYEKVLKRLEKEGIEHYPYPKHKLDIRGHVTWPEIKEMTTLMGARHVIPIYAKFEKLKTVFNKSAMLENVSSAILKNGDMIDFSTGRIVQNVRKQKWIGVCDYSKKKNMLTRLKRPYYKKNCTGPVFK